MSVTLEMSSLLCQLLELAESCTVYIPLRIVDRIRLCLPIHSPKLLNHLQLIDAGIRSSTARQCRVLRLRRI